jgi:hypothetical protein
MKDFDRPFPRDDAAETVIAAARRTKFFCMALALTACWAANAAAENCVTPSDMEPAVRTALVSAGQRYFDFIVKGDAASLRLNAIPSLASDFSAIETTVKDNQAALSGSKGTARSARRVFLRGLRCHRPNPRQRYFFSQPPSPRQVWRGDLRRAFFEERVHRFADLAADRF